MGFKRFVAIWVVPITFLCIAVYMVQMCSLFCPTRCTCQSRRKPDLSELSPTQIWLYNNMWAYRSFCKQICPFLKRCKTASDADDSSQGGNSEGGDSNSLGNLLVATPKEQKTLWMSEGSSTLEPIFLENGWHVLGGSLQDHFVASSGGRKDASSASASSTLDDDDEEEDGGEGGGGGRRFYSSTPALVFFVRVRFARRADRRTPALLEAAPAINYIRACNAMTDKYNLARSLHRYAQLVAATTSVDSSSPSPALMLQPRTYLLNDPEECARFFSTREHYDEGRVWLMKASDMSRGHGISIYDRLSDISYWWYDAATGRCKPEVAAVPQTPGAFEGIGQPTQKGKKSRTTSNAEEEEEKKKKKKVESRKGYLHFFDDDGKPPPKRSALTAATGSVDSTRAAASTSSAGAPKTKSDKKEQNVDGNKKKAVSESRQQREEEDDDGGEEGEDGDEHVGSSHVLYKEPQFILGQEYVKNPLLLGGKKMEIRTYILVASVEPLIVLYHDGTVRRTTRDYRADSWDDPLIHISNTYQQKKHDPGFHLTKDERKWTLRNMEDFVVEQAELKKQNRAADTAATATAANVDSAPGWVNRTLKRRLKSMIATVFKASIHHLRRAPLSPLLNAEMTAQQNRQQRQQQQPEYVVESPPNAFALMGMDVILDDTLRPWLTEMQVGPGMSMDDAVKKALIKPMAMEYLNIALEVAHRKRTGLSLAKLDSVNNFDMVINEISGYDASK